MNFEFRLGCVVEKATGVDIEFRPSNSSSSSVLARLADVAPLQVYSGSISDCSKFCAIITGIPDVQAVVGRFI